MSYNPDENSDLRNQIRKCYHCDEIWINVEGCDGVTKCGSRGWIDYSSKNTIKTSGSKYKFIFTDGIYRGILKAAEFNTFYITSFFGSSSDP